MAKGPTAVGKKIQKVGLDITFNSSSGDLPERFITFLRELRVRAIRGGNLVEGERGRYFSGDYSPQAATRIIRWLRENGGVFPRKNENE